MEEIWKDIPEYEGLYQVSNLGRLKSFKYGKEKNLKSPCNKQGYHMLNLCKNGICKNMKVHQLVAMAFLGHKPKGMNIVIDHINDNPSDNRVENLQIVTQRFNARKTQGKYSSQYKGVSWYTRSNKWVSHIEINNKRYHLGYFKNEYDAHLAYQNALQNLEQ